MRSFKNILVTGGAGFIGSHVIRHLLEVHADLHIVNLDVLTYAGNLKILLTERNFQKVQTSSQDIEGNICDKDLVVMVCFKNNSLTVLFTLLLRVMSIGV